MTTTRFLRSPAANALSALLLTLSLALAPGTGSSRPAVSATARHPDRATPALRGAGHTGGGKARAGARGHWHIEEIERRTGRETVHRRRTIRKAKARVRCSAAHPCHPRIKPAPALPLRTPPPAPASPPATNLTRSIGPVASRPTPGGTGPIAATPLGGRVDTATSTDTPLVSPTATSQSTATADPTALIPTATPTPLPTSTSTATYVPSPSPPFIISPTPTSTPSPIPTPAYTASPMPPTATPSASATGALSPTAAPSATPTVGGATATATPTASPTPTSSSPSTATPTATPPPTSTASVIPPATASSTATSTNVSTTPAPGTATDSATVTPTPTNAQTAQPSATDTPSSTPTATYTAQPATTPTDSPTAGPSATSGAGGTVGDYPRIANIDGLTAPGQVPTFARYGLVVSPRSFAPYLSAFRAQDPAAHVLAYVNSSSVDLPGFDGFSIPPGWWLTLAGTTLTAPLDAAATTVHVADASRIAATLATNPDVLVDGESLHVTAVDTGNDVLTVQRGYLSAAAPHAAGARIAPHATKWAHSWMLNVTPYCPPDPQSGLTWAQYLARQAPALLAAGPWDGLFLDDASTSFSALSDGQLDANNDNLPDGGDGPSGTGWRDGEAALFGLLRAALGSRALLMANGGSYPPSTDGRLYEHFPFYDASWASDLSQYLQIAGPGARPPGGQVVSTINPDTSGSGGAVSYPTLRFDLATALLGDGYFAYDGGPHDHGRTWWFDEYDAGAGSSLAAAVDSSQGSVLLAPGTGSRFRVGDVLRVPDSSGPYDDEQMVVQSISGDTLTVQRGANGTVPSPHAQGSKVATAAQLAAGQGWLGQPLGPATTIAGAGGPDQVQDGDFEAGAGPWALGVTSPASATWSLDRTTAASGTTSAKVVVSAGVAAAGWDVNLGQQGASVAGGQSYTLSFWAKSSAGQAVLASVHLGAAPWTAVAKQWFTTTTGWQQYRLTFTPAASASTLVLQLDVGQSAGTVWLDAVSFAPGDPNVWRRDFAHGTVLLNGTNAAQTVVLGPGYRRIAGTQDPATNSGAAASSVTIPSQDALLLVRSP